MERRTYPLNIILNGFFITRIVIDPHYELKHSESINDDLIRNVFLEMNQATFEVEEVKTRYSYFSARRLHNGKLYKLVWLLDTEDTYIGVINFYRS